MSVRTTHQWVDVLRTGDPNLRVTRQYLEVLVSVNIFSVSATESITVSDEAKPDFFTQSITESITITDFAVPDSFTGSVTESITITDLATPGFTEASCVEAITVGELLYVNTETSNTIIESITIEDSAESEILLDTQVITESIIVADYAESELNSEGTVFVRSAEDSITVSDNATGVTAEKSGLCIEVVAPADIAVSGGTINAEILEHFHPEDYITQDYWVTDPASKQEVQAGVVYDSSIQDSAIYEIIRTASCSERVAVNDSFDPYLIVAVGDHEELCTDAITVTDIASVTDHLVSVTESIIVTDTAVAELSRLATEDITITDTATAEINISLTITEAINVYETLSYELVSATTLCTYSPFIGGSSNPNDPIPPSVTKPTETAQGNFQLYFPVSEPTDTVTLTGPERDDRDKLHFQRINQTSRGLFLHIYADPQWPKVKRLNLGVSVCTEALAQEVLSFIKLTIGKEIGFRDWRNRSWSGIIDNPQSAVVRDSRNNWSVALEIEAELTEL